MKSRISGIHQLFLSLDAIMILNKLFGCTVDIIIKLNTFYNQHISTEMTLHGEESTHFQF